MKASLSLASKLRDRIAAGELGDGDALPVEADLQTEYDLSKPVVREALRILENEGLVQVRRGLGGGPRVRHPSIGEAAMGIGVYLKIDDVQMTDVLETRDLLIGANMERLAEMGDSVDLCELEAVVNALRDRVGIVEGYYVYLVDAGDLVVDLGGSAVDKALVGALRPLIAAELEDATRAVVDLDKAVAIEADVAGAWAKALRNIKAGRGRAARAAYEASAAQIRAGLSEIAPGMTVRDLYGQARI